MVNRSFKTVKATAAHCKELGKTIAQADYEELVALKGDSYVDPEAALLQSFEVCQEVYAIVHKRHGITYAIGGYRPDGACWFICSKYVENFNKEERLAFRKELVANRDAALKVHPVLWNYIWCGNPRHIRFTESCHAVMQPPREMLNGHKYVYFEFRREHFIKEV